MTTGKLRPMTAADLPAAADLLARRHERHRQACPVVAEIDATSAVEHAWTVASGGLVATDASGTVHAYLLWHLRENELWGRFAWVDRADHATSVPELTRDLYAEASRRWVDDGIVKHAVVVPALHDDLDPWERLAFARMQVHALQPLPNDAPPPDARVRASGVDAVERDVRPFAGLIWAHQGAAPVFTGLDAPAWDELRDDWIETLEEDGAIHLVFDDVDGPAGHALVYPADDELGFPAGTARLAAVAVHPDKRGQGVGGALTRAAFHAAREAGFTTIETDWRVTNLEASRTWPALGFVPVFHRLFRVVGTG